MKTIKAVAHRIFCLIAPVKSTLSYLDADACYTFSIDSSPLQ